MENSSKKKFEGFKKPRPSKELSFDYKDVSLLKRYITESGKIIPRRMTLLSAKQQTQLTTAIKRARNLALLSHTSRD